MTRPASQAQIKRNALAGIDALEKRGHPVKGVRISVDGAVSILTEAPADASASLVPLDAELAEWDRKHGHG